MVTLIKKPPKFPMFTTHPEHDLILCCARTFLNSKNTKHLKRLLAKDIDWQYVIKTATQQGVMPLLYWNLSNICPDAVPEIILKQLKIKFENNAAWNLTLTSELLRLLNLFEENGILVIPFKGAVLAASVYNNLTFREFSDLDILVQEEDLDKAKNLLMTEGYYLSMELSWEYHFEHPQKKFCVDLHQAIAPQFFNLPLTFEYLWSRLKPISIADIAVLNLSIEDLLLLLCINFAKDCWHWKVRLSQLCDIAELLRNNSDLDWIQVLNQAHFLHCDRILLLTLSLVKELLKIDLPNFILEKLEKDSTVKFLSEQVRPHILSEVKQKSKKTRWRGKVGLLFDSYNHCLYLNMRERFQDKLIYCSYLIKFFLEATFKPNNKDYQWITLPKYVSFFYYPLHIMRLMIKHSI